MSNVDNRIDEFIAEATDWQGNNLAEFRKIVHDVDPNITEDIKWGVPVFLSEGSLICAMSTFKDHTKFNFFEGASLPDPNGLFNSGLDSKKHRSINLASGDKVEVSGISELVHSAISNPKK